MNRQYLSIATEEKLQISDYSGPADPANGWPSKILLKNATISGITKPMN